MVLAWIVFKNFSKILCKFPLEEMIQLINFNQNDKYSVASDAKYVRRSRAFYLYREYGAKDVNLKGKFYYQFQYFCSYAN